MGRLTRSILENAGIGAMLISPLIVLYVLFNILIMPLDRWGNMLLSALFKKEIPFLGFVLVLLFLALLGKWGRSNRGGFIMRWVKKKFVLLGLLMQGAQGGGMNLVLRSRRPGAPNIILAPYYRKGGLWPFIILRVFETSNPKRPLIAGVFLDFPFIVKGGTVDAEDRVLVDVTFDQAFLFAITSGVGLENFSTPPKEATLGDHIQTDHFKNFMRRNIS